MILAADIGNTNITFGLYDGDRLAETFRMSTRRTGTPDRYARELLSLLEGLGVSEGGVEAVAMASVVPDAEWSLSEGIRRGLGVEPFLADWTVKSGIRVDVEHPELLGSDRLVNAAAAYRFYGGPVLVVDFGTATTYDAVTSDGVFPGGVIAPGIGICAEALSAKTARLPRVELRRPERVLGRNTASCMQSGLLYGYVGQVEYLVKRIGEELGEKPKVVATGGLSGLFRDATGVIDVFDEDLTLNGLYYLYELNRSEN